MHKKKHNSLGIVKPRLLVFKDGESQPSLPLSQPGAKPNEPQQALSPQLAQKKQEDVSLAIEQGKEKAKHHHKEVSLDHAMGQIDAKEAKEVREKQFSHAMPFYNRAEKIASPDHLDHFFAGKTDEIGQIFRLLNMADQLRYSYRETMEGRLEFLRSHETKIRRYYAERQADDKVRPSIYTVPVVSVPAASENRNRAKLDVPEGKNIFMLGSSLSGEMAKDQDLASAGAQHISGADNPEKALTALKEIDPSKLQGGILVVNFGPEMFFGADLAVMQKQTTALLLEAKKHGMKIVMGAPLQAYIYIGSKRCFYESKGKEESIEADKLIKEYRNFLADEYRAGNLHSLVGIGRGMTRSNLKNLTKDGKRNDVLNYYGDDSTNLDDGLNAEGKNNCASAMINGINLALGVKTETVGTSVDYDLNTFGSGVPYDPETKKLATKPARIKELMAKQADKTIELIPGYEKRQSIANLPIALRDHLWALNSICSGVNWGATASIGKLLYHGQNAQPLIDNLPEGDQKDFAQKQYFLLQASAYYGTAMSYALKGENAKALKMANTTEQNNRAYLATVGTDPNARLYAVRLRELINDMQPDSGITYTGFARRKNGRLILPDGTPAAHGTRLNLDPVPYSKKKKTA